MGIEYSQHHHIFVRCCHILEQKENCLYAKGGLRVLSTQWNFSMQLQQNTYSAVVMRESVLVWGTLFPFILEYCFHRGGLHWYHSILACHASKLPHKESAWSLGLAARSTRLPPSPPLRSACVLLRQGGMPGRMSFLFDLHNPPSRSCLVPAKSKTNYFRPWDLLKRSEHFFKGTWYLCFQKVVVKIYWWYLQMSLKCRVSKKLCF